MNILFLDIDGPLVNLRTVMANYTENQVRRTFDPIGIQLLNRVAKETNCQIVFASDWRTMENIGDILRVAGYTGKIFCDGSENIWHISLGLNHRTPDADTRNNRIKLWLNKYGKNIKNYAILDDYTEWDDELIKHWVKVDAYNGISYDNYLQMINLLI